MCIRIQTCNFDRREPTKILHDGVYIFCIGSESDSFCQSLHLCCLLHRQSLPSNLVRDNDDRPFRLWLLPLLPEAISSWLKQQASPLEHCPCAFHWKHSLSKRRTLSFDFDSGLLTLFPQDRSDLWCFEFSSSDQYEVLQTSSIANNLFAHYFERFLNRTKPRQPEAEQSPVILTSTMLPAPHLKAFRSLIEFDPIERRSLGRRDFEGGKLTLNSPRHSPLRSSLLTVGSRLWVLGIRSPSWRFRCAICSWEYEFDIFLSDQYFLSKINIWCIQRLHIFQVCYQDI